MYFFIKFLLLIIFIHCLILTEFINIETFILYLESKKNLLFILFRFDSLLLITLIKCSNISNKEESLFILFLIILFLSFFKLESLYNIKQLLKE